MLISYVPDRSRYEAQSTFAENTIIRAAGGWRWDPTVKCWWVASDEKAVPLAGYADEPTRARLADAIERLKVEQAQTAVVEAKSRATDADIPVPAPDGLAYLPYQRAGIAYGMDRASVLIGDEMGLGKTIQAIGIANADPEARRILIVCPASLKLNWRREWRKWDTKGLRVALANGIFPPESLADVVIINYDVLKKHQRGILARTWDLLIIDECHYLKNPKAQRTQLVFGRRESKKQEALPAIQARRRVALTGTPIVNRPLELWPLVESFDPQGLGRNFFAYAKRYCNAHRNGYGWDFSGSSHLDELQAKLRGTFMVRRLKKDVLTELPPKRRQVVDVPPEGCEDVIARENEAQARADAAIEAARIAVELAKASDDDASYEEAVARLRKAAQVAFEEMSRVRHETALRKAPFVVEFLKGALEAEGKIVAFAHHHDVIDAISKEFGESCVVVDGRTPIEARQSAVDRFQADPSCTLFVGGIHAAGVGLTLTASSHVVFAELDWVPGNLSQAEDRCHRIGQRDSVLVQHLVLDGSVDAKMARTLVAKQAVIDSALDRDHDRKPEAIELPDVVEQQDALAPSEQTPATASVTRKQVAEAAAHLPQSQIDATHACLRALAGMDTDYAQELNGVGFNRYDVRIGHDLAERRSLTAKQAVLGQKIIRKYHRQLPAGLLDAALGKEAA